MAAILRLTTGVVYVRSWSGTLSGTSLTLSGTLSSPTVVADTFKLDVTNQDVLLVRHAAGAGALTATALAATPAEGLGTRNTTAATGGATVQMPPDWFQKGNAWDTSASQSVEWFGSVLPVSAATPSSIYKWQHSLNGAARTTPMTLTSAGVLALTSIRVGTNPSSVGQGVELPNAVGMYARNAANDGNLTLTVMTASDRVQIGDTNTGGVDLPKKILVYNNISTAGWGAAPVYGYGDVAAATGVTASIATYTVGAADGTFEVSANCLVTTATTHSFSLDVTYTDEGNTARTMILPIYSVAGTPVANALIVNGGGTVPYHSDVLTIRAKAATAITVRTSAGGIYTTVVYNARGVIKQVG